MGEVSRQDNKVKFRRLSLGLELALWKVGGMLPPSRGLPHKTLPTRKYRAIFSYSQILRVRCKNIVFCAAIPRYPPSGASSAGPATPGLNSCTTTPSALGIIDCLLQINAYMGFSIFMRF